MRKTKQTHKCCICDEIFICQENLCNDSKDSASICDECLNKSLERLESFFTHNRRIVQPKSWRV